MYFRWTAILLVFYALLLVGAYFVGQSRNAAQEVGSIEDHLFTRCIDFYSDTETYDGIDAATVAQCLQSSEQIAAEALSL